jgi:hypothetical protein
MGVRIKKRLREAISFFELGGRNPLQSERAEVVENHFKLFGWGQGCNPCKVTETDCHRQFARGGKICEAVLPYLATREVLTNYTS